MWLIVFDISMLLLLLLHSSQELIHDFHQMLHQYSPNYVRQFEQILCSVLDDIDKYKADLAKLEFSYKADKERSEHNMRNMIAEAENQLIAVTEQLKLDQASELECKTELLRKSHDKQLAAMNELLVKLQEVKITIGLAFKIQLQVYLEI